MRRQEDEDAAPRGGSVSSARASRKGSRDSARGGKEIKAYFDLEGVVHTVRVTTKGVKGAEDLKERLVEVQNEFALTR